MTSRIDVDIFADIICPWCYIGKTRLDQAFSQRPNLTPVYRWRSFLLNPSMPAEGMDRQAYLTAKFGHAASAVYGRIAMAGLDAGIEFQFSKIQRTPDTRPIHHLMLAAGDKSEILADHFYKAYFLDGQDISEVNIQDEILEACGLDRQTLSPELTAAANQLETDLHDCHTLAIEGVPMIIFNGSLSLAGAYPPDILLNVIDSAARPA